MYEAYFALLIELLLREADSGLCVRPARAPVHVATCDLECLAVCRGRLKHVRLRRQKLRVLTELLDIVVGLDGVVFCRGVSVGVDQQQAVLGVAAVMAPFGGTPEVNGFGGEFRICRIGVIGSYDAGAVDGRAVGVGDGRRSFEESHFTVGVTLGERERRGYCALLAFTSQLQRRANR